MCKNGYKPVSLLTRQEYTRITDMNRYTMPKDEMRLCRREIINFCLHRIYHSKKMLPIKQFVREYERANYGQELKAYA